MIERSLEIESPESNLTSRHTGRSNDNGIDGLIIQDFPDGEVHNYYIQAKLYSAGNNISNGDLRNFIGAYPPQKLIIMACLLPRQALPSLRRNMPMQRIRTV